MSHVASHLCRNAFMPLIWRHWVFTISSEHFSVHIFCGVLGCLACEVMKWAFLIGPRSKWRQNHKFFMCATDHRNSCALPTAVQDHWIIIAYSSASSRYHPWTWYSFCLAAWSWHRNCMVFLTFTRYPLWFRPRLYIIYFQLAKACKRW